MAGLRRWSTRGLLEEGAREESGSRSTQQISELSTKVSHGRLKTITWRHGANGDLRPSNPSRAFWKTSLSLFCTTLLAMQCACETPESRLEADMRPCSSTLRWEGTASGERADHLKNLKLSIHMATCVGDELRARRLLAQLPGSDPDRSPLEIDLLIARAQRERNPLDLVEALSLSEQDIFRQETATNRFQFALAASRLGLAPLAEDAWNEYLEIERRPPWEAIATSLLAEAKAQVERYAAANALFATPNSYLNSRSVSFVVEFPELSRRLAVEQMLGAWARAEASGEPVAPALKSAISEIATHLREPWHDPHLEEIASTLDAESEVMLAGLLDLSEGIASYRAQDLAKAEAALTRSADLLKRAKSPARFWAEYYRAVSAATGDLDSAASMFEELARDTPDRYLALQGQLHWRLGMVAYARNDPSEAIQWYRTAKELLQRCAGEQGGAFSDVLIADALDRIGLPEDAWRHRQEAFFALAPSGDLWQLHSMYHNAAFALANAGRAQQADAFLALLERHAREWNSPIALLGSSLMRHRVAQYTDRVGETRMGELRAWAMELPTGSMRSRMLATVDLIEGISDLSAGSPASEQRVRDAYTNLVATGNQFERLTALRALALAARKSGDVHRALKLTREAIELHHEWLADSSTPSGSIGLARMVSSLHDGALHDLLALNAPPVEVYQALEDARWSNEPWLERAPIHQALEAIPADTVAASTRLLGDGILVATAYRGELAFQHRPLDREKFLREVQLLEDLISADRPMAEVRPVLNQVADLILPSLAVPASADAIWIVPDDYLKSLPFHAMELAQTAGSKSGIHKVVILPGLAGANSLEACEPMGGRTLLVGNPAAPGQPTLIGAENELLEIARIYEAPEVLLRAEAAKPEVVESLLEASLFHFSGHALPSGESFERGGLALSSIVGQDHLLTPSEIFELRLGGLQLAVLSACETSRGSRSRVGMWGLAGAFRAAGARWILAASVPVLDGSTRNFMVDFHKGLAARRCPSHAYHQTVSRFLRADPRSGSGWMALQLIGGASGGRDRFHIRD